MGKEKKIGLAVLGTLFVTLVGAAAVKMSMARDDGLSSLRDADPSVAEKSGSRGSSKLMERLGRESKAETIAADAKREPAKLATFDEKQPKPPHNEPEVGDRYATPISTDAAPAIVLASNVEEKRPESVAIVSSTSDNDPAASSDPFRAPQTSDPFPPPASTLEQSPMTHHHGMAQDAGLVALEGAPALQTAHDESKPGFVHHASPSGSNYVEPTPSRYAQPTSPPPHSPYPTSQERYP
ncbi:MAG TPA: hypothetical protein VHV77_01225, partial [Pirellulales bacterium]|nr:hypothetical protein [Pirellulales bacterium]